jgi:YspA, cpYpsA-related SLOG family
MAEPRPEFRVVVTGSQDFSSAATVGKTLTALLSRKRRSHTVVLLCGNDGPGKFAALWAALNGLEHVYLPDAEPTDQLGTYRNTAVLNDASAFVAFRSTEGWSEVIEDLVYRAKGSGRQVRVVGA